MYICIYIYIDSYVMRYVHISTCWTPIQPAIPGLSRQVPVAGGMSYPTADGTRTDRKGRHGAVNLKSMCCILLMIGLKKC